MRPEKLSEVVAQAVRDALAQAEAEEMAASAAPRLLTAPQVADRLQTNVQAIYRLAREGSLPAVVLGTRSYRWTEHVVTDFIERRGVAAQLE
jgi:excisionase family DNA binding protein